MAISVIEAAKKAGVNFFILCSVLHPMRSKLITHKLKLMYAFRYITCEMRGLGCLRIEEYLVESRINYCILQVC